ncbi:HAD family hydrolase [Herbinix luporum]|uniref:HAD family hydrolase n=1 Tax=Herbinix luporum TaxID=1679721 RepID=UPI0023F4FA4E|nr:HAD family hydrolase [Herbinix luporum]MDI9488628.1 HAD family hydrolase [Bacillota bacterium]
MYDSIIFDLDGTLWDSTKEVAKAWTEVKNKYPEVKDEITADKLKGLFGQLLEDIGIQLFQSVSKEKAIELIRQCCEYENEYLAKHGADLYPGIEELIIKLHKKYKLFIVSNCQEGYIQCFFKVYPQLEKYFTDYEYPGRSGKAKADNIKMVIERNNLKKPVYVGDTAGDAKAAKLAGVPFIYARYGFGQVEEYDDFIDKPLDLLEKLK